MKKLQRSALRLLAVTTFVTIASAVTTVTAQAAYIVNVTEMGGNVVFDGSGSLDTTAWTPQIFTGGRVAFINPVNQLGMGLTTPTASDSYNGAANFLGPSGVGTGPLVSASAGTGDITVFRLDGFPGLNVPVGYTSGAALAATNTYTGHSLSSLGLNPGNYVWSWGSGASADSFTMNVGAVPIPAAVWLFGSGLLGLIGVARRKKA
jgi:hypothetical protein